MTARLDKHGEARVVTLIGADATPAIARKEAKLLHKSAPNQLGSERQDEMRADAELLEAWASREDERDKELQATLDEVRGDDDQGDDATSDATSSSTSDAPSTSSVRRASSKRRTKRAPKTRAAVRRAAGGGDNAAAGAVDAGADLFWRVVTMTLVIVLIGALLRNGKRTAALLRGSGYWVTRMVYPIGAFGPYADQLHNRVNGVPRIGPPAPPRRNP